MFTFTFALCLLADPSLPQVWPAFLGADATAAEPGSLPLRWTPTEHIAWVQPLPGHGQSSPVVYGDRVFVTSVEGPKKDTYHTICLDAQTGEQLWKRSLANSAPVDNSYYVSRAAPTPVVDSQRVVVFFESGDCVAYDHEGQLLWQRLLGSDEGLSPEFGIGSSPCQTESMFFVLLDYEGPARLLGISKQTGETVWKVDRQPRRSWSSPAIVRVDGQPHLVVSSAGTIDGYDPADGSVLWSFDDIGGNTGTTPIDSGDGRFLVGASPGRNGENAGSAAGSNCLMQISREGDGWEITKKWVAEGVSPSWASPILHQGVAYWINRAGVVTALDASTGEEVYTKRLEESSWATPVGVGERVYFFGKDGVVTVLAAGRDYQVLAENESWTDQTLPDEPALGEESSEQRRRAAAMFSKPTLYGFAIANRTIYLRVGNALLAARQ